ncbi:MAG: nickel pincer cofactor biosynthesis protein LarC [Actinobacteria bacterium]|nr:nickel pincer cofactor biosynthesis protein LarC [Actinomycetota bacterium]MBI3688790.1 nickel pincer cofactor biosynthesis protein LarC [Actinomycetota bacterium]
MIGWLDCAAGASGDMFLGALVDAGAPMAAIQAAIDALGTEPIRLEARVVQRQGIGATKVDVHAPRTNLTRTWAHLRGQLQEAALAEPVRRVALAAFERLARAEAVVHRTEPEHVHFHEVGALDAIADVVGAAAGLHALGVEALGASTVTLGNGMVRGEHGLVPVPAPAVLELLREAGAPVWAGPSVREMCTPTGAALLAATVRDWGPMPVMTVRRVGTGAGSRDLAEVPNVLRLVLGTPVVGTIGATTVGATETATGAIAVLLECNVDDLDPRLWPDVLAGLLTAGASDAWLTPILMKKGRPAHTLHVLCAEQRGPALRREIFDRTSTIGVRQLTVGKYALDREYGAVEVGGHRVGVKLARLEGRLVNLSVEFDDVRAAAEALGEPAKEVLRAATAAAHATYGDPGGPITG